MRHCLSKSANGNKASLTSETVIVVPSQRYGKLIEKRLKQVLDIHQSRTNTIVEKDKPESIGLWGLKILTFYQFCQTSLLQAGIFPRLLPDAARLPLLSVVSKRLSQAGKIEKLAPILNTSGTQSSILDLIDEWQRAGYKAADIINKTLPPGKRVAKGSGHRVELAQIYAAYEKAVQETKYIDHHGLVFGFTNLLNKSTHINCLSDFIIIDGFDRFNTMQLELLKALAKHVEHLYIAFDYKEPGDNLFEEYAWKKRSYEQMLALLSSEFEFSSFKSIDSHDPTASIDFADAAPAADAIDFTNATDPTNLTDSKRPIEFFAASDRLAEMSIIAARVKAAIILNNIKPVEIAVTARNLAQYTAAAEAAFQDAGIDYHIDEPIAMNALPIARFLLSLLSMAAQDFERRQVIDCLRSPFFRLSLFDLTSNDIELLNIVSLNKKVVAGRQQWQQAIKAEPRLSTAINTIFDLLSMPSSINTSTAYITWVEDLIDKLLDLSSVSENLDPLLVWKQKEALAKFRALLASLMQAESILHKLKEEIPAQAFYEELEQLVEKANFPAPVYSANKVLITSAELLPNERYKQIYLAGLLEGEFPAVKTNSGFLTAYELEQWKQLGISIYNPRLEPGFEYALFASLINRATEKFTLSYPLTDISSSKDELVPSFFLNGLNIIAPDKTIESLPFETEDLAFNSAGNAFAYSLWHGATPSELTAGSAPPPIKALADQLQEKFSFAQIRSKQLIESPVNGYLVDHVAASAVKIKLPEYWNAGQLNDYGKCPLNFWLTRMLKILPHDEPMAGLSIQDRGTFYHKALELFYKNVIDNKLSLAPQGEEKLQNEKGKEQQLLDEKQLQRSFEKAISAAFDWLEKEPWFRPHEFWPQEKNELAFRLQNFFNSEHNRFMAENGQFTPYLVEAVFGPDNRYPPLVLKQNGKEIKIRGKIDRIDIDSAAITGDTKRTSNDQINNKHLRLIDYKSGSTRISRSDFESGRNIQLPLYALAAEKSIAPGNKVSSYEYLSISTGNGLSPKRQDEAGVQSDLNILPDMVFQFVNKIEKGDFSLKPSSEKVCLSCVHQKVCRIKEFPSRSKQNASED